MIERLRPWLGILLLLAAATSALSQEAVRTAVIDPPGRVARLAHFEGEVAMLPAGPAASAAAAAPQWQDAVLNRPLTSGDALWVGSDGRVQLQGGSTDIYLDHDTAFGFIVLNDELMQVSLTEGAATIRVRRLAQHETIQVETPTAGVVLHHPGEYHLVVTADERTIVRTRSGAARVQDGRHSYTLGAGQEGIFGGPDESPASLAALAPRNEFEAWANERDQRGEHSRSAEHVSTDIIGYEDLDEYGEWLHEPAYGPVWRPLYTAVDWAPYRYGQWSWIAPWGWTWVDDARWGFAPFHYGRWVLVSQRWCWVPGPRHRRALYAPALVGWIGSPSLHLAVGLGAGAGGGVGWYPLAPHEIYRPWYRHTPRHLRQVNIVNTFIEPLRLNYLPVRHRAADQHRYARRSEAVTVIARSRFSGQSIGAQRLAVHDRELRRWRPNSPAPAYLAGPKQPGAVSRLRQAAPRPAVPLRSASHGSVPGLPQNRRVAMPLASKSAGDQAATPASRGTTASRQAITTARAHRESTLATAPAMAPRTPASPGSALRAPSSRTAQMTPAREAPRLGSRPAPLQAPPPAAISKQRTADRPAASPHRFASTPPATSRSRAPEPASGRSTAVRGAPSSAAVRRLPAARQQQQNPAARQGAAALQGGVRNSLGSTWRTTAPGSPAGRAGSSLQRRRD